VDPWVPIVLGAIGAAVSGYVAWLVARRQRSGKIDTTEAADLWKEGKDMRDALIAQIVSLEAKIVALEAKIVALDARLEVALIALRREKDT